jgi:Cytochrome C'
VTIINSVRSRMAVRIRIALYVGAALPLLAACTETNAPHAGQPTPQAQSMQLMLAAVEQIRAYVYGGDITRGDAEKAATDLVSWSGRMAELFPPGQASTDYVDMEPARVSGAPEAMTRAAQQLLATVRTGNRAAVGDQLTRTERDGCGFCHLSGTR